MGPLTMKFLWLLLLSVLRLAVVMGLYHNFQGKIYIIT